MQRKRVGLWATVCVAVVFAVAASDAKAPSVSFGVSPDFVACTHKEGPTSVTASWRIVNPVTSVTITGAVDAKGKALPPIAVSTKPGKHGVVGARKVRMKCTATTQTLTLTAVGPGGTTTRVASLGENRAD